MFMCRESSFGLLQLCLATTLLWNCKVSAESQPQLTIDPGGVRGNWVTSMDISRDGKWLAAADGTTVRVWQLSDLTLWYTLRGFQEQHAETIGAIKSVVFSPDSRFLVVGVSDNTNLGSTRVYELANPDRIHRLLPGHSGCTSGVTFSPDGDHLATWSCDGTIIVSKWNADQGDTYDPFQISFRKDPRFASRNFFAYFGFPLDDEWLIHCDGYSYQAISIRRRRAINDSSSLPAKLRTYFSSEAIDSPGPGLTHLRSPMTNDLLRAEVLNRTCPVCGGDAPQRAEHDSRARSRGITEKLLDIGAMQLSKRDLIAVGASTVRQGGPESDYWIGVWNSAEGTPQGIYNGHRFFPTAVTLEPELGIAASADALGEIHVWHLQTKRVLHRLRSGAKPIYRVYWPEDNNNLWLSMSPYKQSEFRYNANGPIDHAISLDTRRLDRTTLDLPSEPAPMMYDRVTNQAWKLSSAPGSGVLQLNRISTEGYESLHASFYLSDIGGDAEGDTPTSFDFLPGNTAFEATGTILVGTQRGRLLQLKPDGENLKVVRMFYGHDSTVSSISVAPDRRHVATSSFDGTVRIWRLDRPRVLGDVAAVLWGNQVMGFPETSNLSEIGIDIADQLTHFDGKPFYERMSKMLAGDYRPGQKVKIGWKHTSASLNPTDQTGSSVVEQEAVEHDAIVELQPAPDVAVPVLSFFFSTTGQWVAWEPHGHYDSSPNGERFIGFHVNAARHEPAMFHSVQQFHSLLYSPTVIDQLLAKVGFEITQLDQVTTLKPPSPIPEPDVAEDFDEIQPPHVEFVGNLEQRSTTYSDILVEADIMTQKSHPVKEIIFRVNGRVPRERYEVQHSIDKGDTVFIHVQQKIELEPGSNRIELSASHRHATSRTARMLVARDVQREDKVVRPNLFVLSVGVSKHQDRALDLRFADKDAQDIVDTCTRMKDGLYGNVECKLLVNEEATAGNIRSAMGWLAKNASDPRDTAIIFFAGHGAYDEEEWFFSPHDIDLEDLNRAKISMHEMAPWLQNKIRAGHKIAFFDTCHAAGIQTHRTLKKFNSKGSNPWQNQEDAIYFVSCLSKETAIEKPEFENGAFTEVFLNALNSKEADTDGDGHLWFTELEAFLNHEVAKITDNKQHPSAKKPLDVPDFRVFQVPVK